MTMFDEHAIMILRYLRENGITLGNGVTCADLCRELNIPEREFDAADSYLLQNGFVEGGGGGPDAERWLTAAGTDWVRHALQERLSINLDAEKIVRFIYQDARKNEIAASGEILAALNLTSDRYIEACFQLQAFELIEEIYPGENFIGLRLTQEGKRALLNNFQRPEVINPTINAGLIVQGSVTGSNIQALANAYSSQIQQTITTNDPSAIKDEIEQLLDKIVNEALQDLSLKQKRAYAQLASELQAEISKEQPEPGVLRKLLAGLGFFADVGGTLDLGEKAFDLIVKVGPSVIVLSQLIAQLLGVLAR